jgi:hypothetical protein
MALALSSLGQMVDVRSHFDGDSVRIGEPIPYALTARYPKELNLLFPDSAYSFAPFEFSSKKYFPTQTTGSISYDSVVYYLTTYEIDSLQKLSLPVFLVHPSDCTAVFSSSDTVYLKHTVAIVPDSVAAPQLPLKTQTSYLQVKWLFNYPLWLIIGGALLVLLIIGWFVFGKRIRHYFQIRRMERYHRAFLARYNDALEQLKEGFSSPKAERALVVWKEYMENLEAKPYTKYTSREIVQIENDEQLSGPLKDIDRMVYASQQLDPRSFSALKEYSESRFNQKLEEVRHD